MRSKSLLTWWLPWYAHRCFCNAALLIILQWTSIVNFPWDKVNAYIVYLSSKLVSGQRLETSSIIDRILGSNHPAVQAAESYLEVWGKQVMTSSYQVATSWTRMALGDGTGERIFAIILGYAVIGLLIAFYLNVFTVGSVKSAGRAVRSAVRQQLLVVKVGELTSFPPIN
jgi:E3 ubiquitin-protein ligase MARCH6